MVGVNAPAISAVMLSPDNAGTYSIVFTPQGSPLYLNLQ